MPRPTLCKLNCSLAYRNSDSPALCAPNVDCKIDSVRDKAMLSEYFRPTCRLQSQRNGLHRFETFLTSFVVSFYLQCRSTAVKIYMMKFSNLDICSFKKF